LIRAIKALIILFVLANVLIYATAHSQFAFSAYPYVLVGRAPDCPWTQIARAYGSHWRQPAVMDQIDRASTVVERAPGNLTLFQTPKGRFWVPDGMNLSWLLAEQEVKYASVGGQQVRPGDIVLDCGANVGVFTRAALSANAKTVVAIEPSPRNIAALRRTFAAEIAAGQVILYPTGVWDRDDFLTLNESTTSAEDSFVMHREGAHGGVKVPLTTIDKLAQELHLTRVDFIKMDIEGAEQRALAGAGNTIARYRPRMEISVNHLPEDPQKVPAIIRQAWSGYRHECLKCEPAEKAWRIESEILYFH